MLCSIGLLPFTCQISFQQLVERIPGHVSYTYFTKVLTRSYSEYMYMLREDFVLPSLTSLKNKIPQI